MKRKILYFILAAAVLVSCVFAVSCDSCNKDTEKQSSPPEGKQLLNGLDDMNDLYLVKWTNTDYDTVGTIDITDEEGYVKEGTGSLKADIKHSSGEPRLRFSIQDTYIPDMDISNVKTFSAWVYNGCEDRAEITLALLDDGVTQVLSQSFELAAGEWTECVMNVNAVVTYYLKEEISGFSLQFNRKGAMAFCIDGIAVEFGSEFSQEDSSVMNDIAALVADINAIPERITVEIEPLIKELYMRYGAVPELYRSAINNYDVLTSAMADLLYAQTSLDGQSQDAQMQRKAFYFDKFYGITSFKNAETSANTFGYSTDIKHADDEGSCYIQYDGDIWNYTDITSGVMLDGYDYVEFWIYNEGETKAIWWKNAANGWQERTDIDEGEWVRMSMPTSYFDASGIQIIVTTSINYGAATNTEGRLYISSITCYKLGATEMFESALDGNDPFVISGGGTLSPVDNGVLVSVTQSGSVDIMFNKEKEDLNVAQNFVLSVYSPKSVSATLIDEEGNKIASGASVFVAEGWNTLTLSGTQYNAAAGIRIEAVSGEEYEFKYGYVTRITDMQGIKLVIERGYLKELGALTAYDLPQIIQYLSIYDNAGLEGLRLQFVKVTESADPELYAEQTALYEEVVQYINALADKADELIKGLIDGIDPNTDAGDLYLLDGIYSDYLSAALAKELGAEYEVRAEVLLDALDSLPKLVADVSDSAARATFGITSSYSWKGTISGYEDAEHGTVMRVAITERSEPTIEMSFDTGVILTGYDTVRFSVYVSGNTRTVSIYFATKGWGNTLAGPFTLTSEGWTEVIVPANAYTVSGYMIITDIAGHEPYELLFTDFYAYNENYVINLINALPDPDEVTDADAAAIAKAREEYKLLGSGFKSKVTNLDKLVACETAIQQGAVQDILDMITALPAGSINDENYAEVEAARAEYNALHEEIKALITNYNILLSCEAEYVDYLIKALPKGSITVENYADVTAVRAKYEALESEAKAMVTQLETLLSCEAELVVNLINALPVPAELTFEAGATMAEIRLMYNGLSAEAKAYVTNYAVLETAEEAFAEKFKVIEEMADTGAFTIPDSTQEWWYHSRERVKLSAVSDEIYGNCLRIEYTGQGVAETGHAAMEFDQSGYAEALAGCEKVYFYVYNGTSGGVGLLSDIQGVVNGWYKTLQPNSWNLIEISVEDFLKGSVIGIGDAKVGEYLISAIYAE